MPRVDKMLSRTELVSEITARTDASSLWLGAGHGTGKTILAAQWTAFARGVVCVTLDDADVDLDTFFNTFVHALSAAGLDAERLPNSAPSSTAEELSRFSRTFFREWYARIPDGARLVVDDVQVLDRSALLRSAIAMLCDERPADIRLLLVSTSKPFEELSRAIAAGRLVELDENRLALSVEQAKALAATRTNNASEAEKLCAFVDGWIVGLLLGLEKMSAQSIRDFDADIFDDYFATTMWHSIPRTDRLALSALSQYEQFTIDDAACLWNVTFREANSRLAAWTRARWFVNRDESNPLRFRLHRIGRQFLARQWNELADADTQTAFAVRAAVALIRAQQLDAACALFMSRNLVDDAAQAIGRHAAAYDRRGQFAVLSAAIKTLPEQIVLADPHLFEWRARADTFAAADEADGARTLQDLFRAYEVFEKLRRPLHAARTLVHIYQLIAHREWEDAGDIHRWEQEMIKQVDRLARRPYLEQRLQLMACCLFDRISSRLNSEVRQQFSTFLKTHWLHVRDDQIRLSIATALLQHCSNVGQLDDAREIVRLVTPFPRDLDASPVDLADWACRVIYYLAHFFGDRNTAAQTVDAMIAQGLHTTSFLVYWRVMLNRVDLAIANGSYDMAETVLAEVETMHARASSSLRIGLLQRRLLMDLMQDRFDRTQSLVEALLNEQRSKTGLPQRLPMRNLRSCAIALYIAGDIEAAEKICGELLNMPVEGVAGASENHAIGRILQALIAYARGVALSDVLVVARWRAYRLSGERPIESIEPALARRLCVWSLSQGLEVNEARRIAIDAHIPPPRPIPALWPRPWRLELLGDMRLLHLANANEVARNFGKGKVDALLGIMAVAGEHGVTQEQVIDDLWPELDGDRAKGAFEIALSRLRKQLGEATLIRNEAGRLWLDRTLCEIDLDWLLARIALAQRADKDDADLHRVFEAWLAVLDEYRGVPLMLLRGHRLIDDMRSILRQGVAEAFERVRTLAVTASQVMQATRVSSTILRRDSELRALVSARLESSKAQRSDEET